MSKVRLIDVLGSKSPAADLAQRRAELQGMDAQMRQSGATGRVGFADLLVPMMTSRRDKAAEERAASAKAETERQARILDAVVYSPTPVVDWANSPPTMVPLAKTGITARPDAQGNLPVAFDVTKLQPGDLEYLQSQGSVRQ